MKEDFDIALLAILAMQIFEDGSSFLFEFEVELNSSDAIDSTDIFFQTLFPGCNHHSFFSSESHVRTNLLHDSLAIIISSLFCEVFEIGESGIELIIEFGGLFDKNIGGIVGVATFGGVFILDGDVGLVLEEIDYFSAGM